MVVSMLKEVQPETVAQTRKKDETRVSSLLGGKLSLGYAAFLMIWRPSYWPQDRQTRCGSLGAWQLGQAE
jgi:hypothetical protein